MTLRQIPSSGFTLVEMAIVLAILGFLLGGLIIGLSDYSETQRIKDTRANLALVREALLSYAAAQGRLPCPDTNADGVEDGGCSGSTIGQVPWATLGLSPRDASDAWGGNPAAAVFFYRADSNFANPVTSSDTNDGLRVRNLAATTTYTYQDPHNYNNTSVAAVVFSAGKNLTLDGDNGDTDADYTWDTPSDAPGSIFDDELIWISKYQVIGRMAQAGKWPP